MNLQYNVYNGVCVLFNLFIKKTFIADLSHFNLFSGEPPSQWKFRMQHKVNSKPWKSLPVLYKTKTFLKKWCDFIINIINKHYTNRFRIASGQGISLCQQLNKKKSYFEEPCIILRAYVSRRNFICPWFTVRLLLDTSPVDMYKLCIKTNTYM